MKKFIFLLVLLAAGQATLADELIVVAEAENGTYHVKYSAERTCDTRMIIQDADGNRIFSEVIRNQCSFIRPYNLSQLPYGRYTIIASNAYSKKITYVDHEPKPEATVTFKVTRMADGRYLLQIPKADATRVHVSILQDDTELYFNTIKLSGDFACVYNIKSLSDSDIKFEIKAAQ